MHNQMRYKKIVLTINLNFIMKNPSTIQAGGFFMVTVFITNHVIHLTRNKHNDINLFFIYSKKINP